MNVKNKEGETPLLTASARGYYDIVECLAEHRADLHATDKVSYLQRSQGHLSISSFECYKSVVFPQCEFL